MHYTFREKTLNEHEKSIEVLGPTPPSLASKFAYRMVPSPLDMK